MAKRERKLTNGEQYEKFLTESVKANYLDSIDNYSNPGVKDIVNWRGKGGEEQPDKLDSADLSDVIEKITGKKKSEIKNTEVLEALYADDDVDSDNFFFESLDNEGELSDDDDWLINDDDTGETDDLEGLEDVEHSPEGDEEHIDMAIDGDDDSDMHEDLMDLEDGQGENLDIIDDGSDGHPHDNLEDEDTMTPVLGEIATDPRFMNENVKPKKNKAKNSLLKESAPLSILEEGEDDLKTLQKLLREMENDLDSTLEENFNDFDSINEEIVVDLEDKDNDVDDDDLEDDDDDEDCDDDMDEDDEVHTDKMPENLYNDEDDDD